MTNVMYVEEKLKLNLIVLCHSKYKLVKWNAKWLTWYFKMH